MVQFDFCHVKIGRFPGIIGFSCIAALCFVWVMQNEQNRNPNTPMKISSQRQQPLPMPPVHMDSSWMGNMWIPPPGYRLYSTQEIRDYLKRHSILFVGDSTARRMYGTLHSLLNETSPDDISVESMTAAKFLETNKDHIIEECFQDGRGICRKNPQNSSNYYDFAYQKCLDELGIDPLKESYHSLVKEWAHQYTLTIFMLGPWELMDKTECGDGRKDQTDNLFQRLFQEDDSESTNFVWRTWGTPGTTSFSNPQQDEKLWHKARAHNDYVKMLIDKNAISRKNAGKATGAVSYVDWGQVMLPRSYPFEQRISGDIDPNYGLEARLTFIQMLMNHLVERDRQKELNMTQWLSTDHAYNHSHRDPEHFMTTSILKIAELQEREELSKIKLSFCGQCVWRNGNSCNERKAYMTSHYGTSELEALKHTMQEISCNNTAI